MIMLWRFYHSAKRISYHFLSCSHHLQKKALSQLNRNYAHSAIHDILFAGQLRVAHGPSIVNGLARAVSVGRLPTCTFHDAGDVLHELMVFDRVAVCKWLEEALTALPTK